jgi:hypothetical protein
MKKIMFTHHKYGLCVISPEQKHVIEKALGPLSDAEYEQHVFERNKFQIGDASYKLIEDTDIPISREFRAAWCDTQPGTQIDIDLDKAKDIQLERLREKRNHELDKMDKEYMKALTSGLATADIELKMQGLRDATEPLKALDCKGKYNDDALLQQIKNLGEIK